MSPRLGTDEELLRAKMTQRTSMPASAAKVHGGLPQGLVVSRQRRVEDRKRYIRPLSSKAQMSKSSIKKVKICSRWPARIGTVCWPLTVMYSIGEDHLTEFLQQGHNDCHTALPLIAASGDCKVIRKLLEPSKIFQQGHPSRGLLLCQDPSFSIPLLSFKRSSSAAQQQLEDWARAETNIPSFLRSNFVHMTKPERPLMTIGSNGQRTEGSLCLPNVTVPDWGAPRGQKKQSFPVAGSVCKPLQLASGIGHLEAVKLLLNMTETVTAELGKQQILLLRMISSIFMLSFAVT